MKRERFSFRAARIEDAEAVSALVNSGYRGDSSRAGWTTEADLLGGQRTDAELIREMILAGEHESDRASIELMFSEAASGERALLASVYLKREDPQTCYLGMLTVDPRLQGGGHGKRLLEHSERIALEWGCRRIRMVVIHQRPELIAYYERRGYVLTGVSEPFPEVNPRMGLPLVEGLRLDELIKPLD